jgi:hypothetical protein
LIHFLPASGIPVTDPQTADDRDYRGGRSFGQFTCINDASISGGRLYPPLTAAM